MANNTGLVLFGGKTEYPFIAESQTQERVNAPGFVQVIYMTVQLQTLNAIVEMFDRWFSGREEVEIVDYGTSDKRGVSFLVIEWLECEIDQLFLDILDSEDAVIDYTEYSREVD